MKPWAAPDTDLGAKGLGITVEVEGRGFGAQGLRRSHGCGALELRAAVKLGLRVKGEWGLPSSVDLWTEGWGLRVRVRRFGLGSIGVQARAVPARLAGTISRRWSQTTNIYNGRRGRPLGAAYKRGHGRGHTQPGGRHWAAGLYRSLKPYAVFEFVYPLHVV